MIDHRHHNRIHRAFLRLVCLARAGSMPGQNQVIYASIYQVNRHIRFADELTGFCNATRNLSTKLSLNVPDNKIIDLSGTGGSVPEETDHDPGPQKG